MDPFIPAHTLSGSTQSQSSLPEVTGEPSRTPVHEPARFSGKGVGTEQVDQTINKMMQDQVDQLASEAGASAIGSRQVAKVKPYPFEDYQGWGQVKLCAKDSQQAWIFKILCDELGICSDPVDFELGSGQAGNVRGFCDEQHNRYAVKILGNDSREVTRGPDQGEVMALNFQGHESIVDTYALLLSRQFTEQYCFIRSPDQWPTENRDQFHVKACISRRVDGSDLFERLLKLQQQEDLYGQSRESVLQEQLELTIKAGLSAASAAIAIKNQHAVYRDIKPENILIDDETNKAFVCDFGFCKSLDVNGRASSRCGTVDYLAPEVLSGADEDQTGYTGAVDNFSLGMTLFMGSCLHQMSSEAEFQNSNESQTEAVDHYARCSDAVKELKLKYYGRQAFKRCPELMTLIIKLTRFKPEERMSLEEAHEQLTLMAEKLGIVLS